MRTRLSQSSSDPVQSFETVSHRSVLLHEAIEQLQIRQADTVVDATLGGGGHAREITRHLDTQGTLIGFDLDPEAIARAEGMLRDSDVPHHLIRANFRAVSRELETRRIQHIDKALFDLGWSAFQLSAGRGFSFLSDEPLLMTYSKNDPQALTAEIIVNEWKEESIADILYGWGEERYSRRIAKAIVARRIVKPFAIASDLAATIKAAVPHSYRFGRIHPATRTFQALRIAVNDELGALTQGITETWRMLSMHGRIAVITFHSIEDRIVKQLFAGFEKEGSGRRITKKPIVPSPVELQENPRSRSAKLRGIEKI